MLWAMHFLRERRPAGVLAFCALCALLTLAQASTALAAAAATSTGRATTSSSVSGGAIAIAVVAGVVALACLVWAVARRRALEPRWLLSLRHSLAEAGLRASETWAELGDWLRLGR
jgi:hypothetical protein